jgi:hypothetical protein
VLSVQHQKYSVSYCVSLLSSTVTGAARVPCRSRKGRKSVAVAIRVISPPSTLQDRKMSICDISRRFQPPNYANALRMQPLLERMRATRSFQRDAEAQVVEPTASFLSVRIADLFHYSLCPHSGFIQPLIPKVSGHPFQFYQAIYSGASGHPLM